MKSKKRKVIALVLAAVLPACDWNYKDCPAERWDAKRSCCVNTSTRENTGGTGGSSGGTGGVAGTGGATGASGMTGTGGTASKGLSQYPCIVQ